MPSHALSRARFLGKRIVLAVTEPPHWRDRPWADQVVFVCGCGHSGTSLLLRILAAHPAVYAPMAETKAFMATTPWPFLRDLRRDCLAAGKRVLVEKTPQHIRHMDRIRQAVPGARFVVMVRDGRDVTASITRRIGDPAEGLKRWVGDTLLSRRAEAMPDTMILRYEDLTEDAEGRIREVCRFIGIPFDPSMLDYHRTAVTWNGKDGSRKGSGQEGEEHRALRAWQLNQPIFNGTGQWRGDLPPEIVARLFDGVPGELMAHFGYVDDTSPSGTD
jgi:hypothetical protein